MRVRMLLKIAIPLLLLSGNYPAIADTSEKATIVLDRAAHFLTPDGTNLIVEPGAYRVEASEAHLKLVQAESGNTITIQTEPFTPEESLAVSAILLIPEDEDLFRLVLLRPDQKSLAAVGSYSGVQTRAVASQAQTDPYLQIRIKNSQMAYQVVNQYGKALFSCIQPFDQREPVICVTIGELSRYFPEKAVAIGELVRQKAAQFASNYSRPLLPTEFSQLFPGQGISVGCGGAGPNQGEAYLSSRPQERRITPISLNTASQPGMPQLPQGQTIGQAGASSSVTQGSSGSPAGAATSSGQTPAPSTGSTPGASTPTAPAGGNIARPSPGTTSIRDMAGQILSQGGMGQMGRCKTEPSTIMSEALGSVFAADSDLDVMIDTYRTQLAQCDTRTGRRIAGGGVMSRDAGGRDQGIPTGQKREPSTLEKMQRFVEKTLGGGDHSDKNPAGASGPRGSCFEWQDCATSCNAQAVGRGIAELMAKYKMKGCNANVTPAPGSSNTCYGVRQGGSVNPAVLAQLAKEWCDKRNSITSSDMAGSSRCSTVDDLRKLEVARNTNVCKDTRAMCADDQAGSQILQFGPRTGFKVGDIGPLPLPVAGPIPELSSISALPARR